MAHVNNVEHNSLIETVVTFFGNHPIAGFSMSAITLAVGVAVKVVETQTEIPLIVMQVFQLIAWTAAIIGGTMTAYGVWRTHHGKKKNK